MCAPRVPFWLHVAGRCEGFHVRGFRSHANRSNEKTEKKPFKRLSLLTRFISSGGSEKRRAE